MRLDKYLCESGKGTRSEVKKLISKGRASVNGAVVRDSAFQLEPEADEIKIDGENVKYAAFEYFMLNKPKDVISASRADLRNPNEVCVVDLIKDKIRNDLFPVGRLDKDTVGLLLITNDGALSHRLLSPKKHVDKTYYVELSTPIGRADIEMLEAGVDIGDEKPTLPCKIEKAIYGIGEACNEAKAETEAGRKPNERSEGSSFFITIHEGRFHQIKRMFETCGSSVTYLKRIKMGPLELDEKLKEGEYRRLTDDELSALLLL